MSTIRRPLRPRAVAALTAAAVVAIAIIGGATTRSAPSAGELARSSSTPSGISVDAYGVSAADGAIGVSDRGDVPNGADGATGSAAGTSTATGTGTGTASGTDSRASGGRTPSATPTSSRPGQPAAESDEAEAAGIPPFPESPVADYQVDRAYTPDPAATLVVRDVTAAPVPGLYNVCSVDAFQTRPADVDFWLSNNRDLVLWDAAGAPVSDATRPGAYVLDISSSAKRARIADIQTRFLRDCASRGFQAVVLDDLDSFTRAQNRFDLGAASAYAALLTAKAHALGLPIGQKNTPQLGWAGSDEIGFDFAIAEGCVAAGNCSAFRDVYGKRVVDVEYTHQTTDFAAVCGDARRPTSVILRDPALSVPGTPGYTLKRCPV